MNKKLKQISRLLIIQLASLSFISACSSPDNSAKGIIKIAVSFPEQSFSVKAMPSDTTKIDISVTGVNMRAPINFSLNKEKTSEKLYTEQGNTTIKAIAFDKDGKQLAKGEQSINIKPYISNKVNISLDSNIETPVTPNPSITPPTSVPNPSQSVSPSTNPNTGSTPMPTPTPVLGNNYNNGSNGNNGYNNGGSSNNVDNSSSNLDVDIVIDTEEG